MIRLAESRLTRIVCELSEDVLLSTDTIPEMIKEGMDLAVIEVRSQEYRTYETLKRQIDDAASHFPTIIGTILTVLGANRQVFRLPICPLQVSAGATVHLLLEESDCDNYVIMNSLEGFQLGLQAVFGPNHLTAEVVEVAERHVTLRAVTDGSIQLHTRVYIGGSSAFADNFTEKQLRDIDFGVNVQFNYLSFCFSQNLEQEMAQIRARIGKKKTKVLARLESMLGSQDLIALVNATDGVILERCALEVQMPIEKLCTYKKLVVHTCGKLGKPILISGHVLGSLQTLPYPLRADACDVYNGVIDGSDGFILSDLILTPDLWRNSVLMMKNIVASAEKNLKPPSPLSWMGETPTILEALASSAVKTCQDLKSRYLITVLHAGQTARLLSKYKPPVPIIVLANDLRVLEQALVHRGTIPMLADVSEHRRLLAGKVRELKASGYAQVEQTIVILSEKNLRNVASFQAILSVIAVE